MTVDFPRRIAFEDHRILQASDLMEQHEYHIQRRWQHNLAMHSWGIMCGLNIQIDIADAQSLRLQVRPGMAIDGYGREIVLTKQVFAPSKQQLLDPSISYDLWILYRKVSDSASVDPYTEDCESRVEELARTNEIPEILIRPTTDRQSGSVTRPTGVPISDLQFQATQAMKFDDNDRWPVFIGRIECISNKWVLDETERYYGGLKAERIEFPGEPIEPTPGDNATHSQRSARTMIINGGHPGHNDLCFAVVEVPSGFDINRTESPLEELRAPISIRSSLAPMSESKDKPVMDSEIRFNADRVNAEGNFVLRDGSALQFEHSTVQDNALPVQLPPASWGIYRRMHIPAEINKEFADALHFSMPQDEKGNNRITFGATSEDGTFKPILVVHSNQVVEILGTLKVHGSINGVLSQVPFEPEKFLALNKLELTSNVQQREAGPQKEILDAVFLGVTKVEAQDVALTIKSFPKTKLLFGELLALSLDLLGADIVASKIQNHPSANDFYKAFVDPLVSNVDATALANAIVEIQSESKKKDALRGIIGNIDIQITIEAVIAKDDSKLFEGLLAKALDKSAVNKIAEAIQAIDPVQRKGIYESVANFSDFVQNLKAATRQKLAKALAEKAQKDFLDGGFKASNFSAMVKNICRDSAKSKELIDSLPTDDETRSILKANLTDAQKKALKNFVNAVTDEPPTPPEPDPDPDPDQ